MLMDEAYYKKNVGYRLYACLTLPERQYVNVVLHDVQLKNAGAVLKKLFYKWIFLFYSPGQVFFSVRMLRFVTVHCFFHLN